MFAHGARRDDELPGDCFGAQPVRYGTQDVELAGSQLYGFVAAARGGAVDVDQVRAQQLQGEQVTVGERLRASAAEVVQNGRIWFANWGNDHLYGGKGKDTMRGSAGQDVIGSPDDDGQRDVLLGYAGRDKLNARDGRANDSLDGGSARDRCRRDLYEHMIRCEAL